MWGQPPPAVLGPQGPKVLRICADAADSSSRPDSREPALSLPRAAVPTFVLALPAAGTRIIETLGFHDFKPACSQRKRRFPLPILRAGGSALAHASGV